MNISLDIWCSGQSGPLSLTCLFLSPEEKKIFFQIFPRKIFHFTETAVPRELTIVHPEGFSCPLLPRLAAVLGPSSTLLSVVSPSGPAWRISYGFSHLTWREPCVADTNTLQRQLRKPGHGSDEQPSRGSARPEEGPLQPGPAPLSYSEPYPALRGGLSWVWSRRQPTCDVRVLVLFLKLSDSRGSWVCYLTLFLSSHHSFFLFYDFLPDPGPPAALGA